MTSFILILIGADNIDHGDQVHTKPNLSNSSSHVDPDGSDDYGLDPHGEKKDECSDASLDQIDQFLSSKVVSSKSCSEDRPSDSSSARCSSPSSTSHDDLDMENKAVSSLSVKDNLCLSTSCQGNSISDTSIDIHPSNAPDGPENCNLVQRAANSPAEPVSDWEGHLPAAVNGDTAEFEMNLMLDSQMMDNTSSFREVDMNDFHEEHEVVPSGTLFENGVTNNNIEHTDVSDSELNHEDKKETKCEGEINLYLDPEVASKEMQFYRSDINASNDSSETDLE